MIQKKILNTLENILSILQNQCINKKDVLSIEEATEYMNISKSFLYKLTSKKKIPYYKPSGKIVYFKREDLDKWMTQYKCESIDEAIIHTLKHLKKGGNHAA